MEEQSALEHLKKQYESLRKKYSLTEFPKLNQEFEIEKIQERETELLLREIRHCMSERIASFLHFVELFLNPTMAPIFVLSAMKEVGERDKELIEKLYRELAAIELSSVALDVNYDEKKEAAFIKDVFKKWQDIKPELEEFSELLIKLSPKAEKRKNYVG
jgi:hypothetical protein